MRTAKPHCINLTVEIPRKICKGTWQWLGRVGSVPSYSRNHIQDISGYVTLAIHWKRWLQWTGISWFSDSSFALFLASGANFVWKATAKAVRQRQLCLLSASPREACQLRVRSGGRPSSSSSSSMYRVVLAMCKLWFHSPLVYMQATWLLHVTSALVASNLCQHHSTKRWASCSLYIILTLQTWVWAGQLRTSRISRLSEANWNSSRCQCHCWTSELWSYVPAPDATLFLAASLCMKISPTLSNNARYVPHNIRELARYFAFVAIR